MIGGVSCFSASSGLRGNDTFLLPDQNFEVGGPKIPKSLRFRKILERVYTPALSKPIWLDGENESLNYEVLKSVILMAYDHGLNPNDYPLYEKKPTDLWLRDILISNTYLTLIHDMRFGRKPHFRFDSRREGRSEFLTAQLRRLEYGIPVSWTFLDDLAPYHPQYLGLKREYQDNKNKDFLGTLEVNLDLWRALPRDLGSTYLLVILPEAKAQLYRDGHLKFESSVLVGSLKGPTPTMITQIKSIDTNPSWYIPSKIVLDEILPKAVADSNYLARHEIRVETRVKKQSVDSTQIDWSTVKSEPLPYRFIQQPGPKNPLGQLRFNLENPFAIHIHDTPERQLFFSNNRLRTHGCLRIDRARELAGLLSGPNIDIDALIDEIPPRFRKIRLPKPIPVYIVYLTAWVDDTGVRYSQPIYGPK